jgi:hypothetical protein
MGEDVAMTVTSAQAADGSLLVGTDVAAAAQVDEQARHSSVAAAAPLSRQVAPKPTPRELLHRLARTPSSAIGLSRDMERRDLRLRLGWAVHEPARRRPRHPDPLVPLIVLLNVVAAVAALLLAPVLAG